MSRGRPLIVAIDGPSGVGKSTVARGVAHRLDLPYLETGAMYRALGSKVLESGVDPGDRAAVEELARELDLVVEFGPAGEVTILLDGSPVGERIREPRVSDVTSQVAVYPGVRERMVRLQRQFGARRGAVLEGRDIGTQVFPDTPYKFFVTARPDVRAERRFLQHRELGKDVTRDGVQHDLVERDRRDESRDASPLAVNDSYVEIDTSDLTADEVVDRLEQAVRERSR